MSRRVLALLAAAAVLTLPGVAASGADFAASSATGASTFTTAADFNTIAVTLSDPGTPIFGTVTLASTATSERGITGVVYEAQLGAGAWTPVCTASAAPWSCAWDSTTAANGTYSLRAVATDAGGYTRASPAIASRVVDNSGPAVTLNDPGAYLQGTVTVGASATDTGTGVSSLAIEYRRSGTTSWTQLCTGATSPRSCAFNSTVQADGDLDFRAVGRDGANNARATTTLSRRVDNTAPSVTNTDGPTMRGVATITATADDGAGTGIASVAGQVRAQGAATWTTACTDTSAPYSCTYNTAGLADGPYETRSVATDNTGLTAASAIVARRVDNAVPTTATLADPGTMSATKALTGTAADGASGSGVASWSVQYRTAGGTTWTDACVDSAAPWASCSWDTTAVADGLYDVRAVVADAAGNTTSSTPLTSRRVDNLGPTVTLSDPGAAVRGAITLNATATDPVGVASVIFERKSSSGTTWTTVCTDTTAPYSCALDTTTLADGLYDLRARATDTLTHSATATVTARQVDNTAPAPADVQAGNGGATPGRIEAGDWLRFTWSEAVNPASIMTGWTGTATAVTVKVIDGNKFDTIEIDDASGTTELKLAASRQDLKLNGDFVGSDAVFDGTMVQSGTSVTITIGTRRSGTMKTVAATTMTWIASNGTTDFAGNACPTGAQATESGTADVDF